MLEGTHCRVPFIVLSQVKDEVPFKVVRLSMSDKCKECICACKVTKKVRKDLVKIYYYVITKVNN